MMDKNILFSSIQALNCRSGGGPKEAELKTIYKKCLKMQEGKNSSKGTSEQDWKEPRGQIQRNDWDRGRMGSKENKNSRDDRMSGRDKMGGSGMRDSRDDMMGRSSDRNDRNGDRNDRNDERMDRNDDRRSGNDDRISNNNDRMGGRNRMGDRNNRNDMTANRDNRYGREDYFNGREDFPQSEEFGNVSSIFNRFLTWSYEY